MSDTNEQFDYAAKTKQLEALLERMQTDDIKLDEALELHKTGKALIAQIEEYLQEAEIVIKKQLSKGR
ncbi:exodeoxyribonuclease VII small subunit [Candidatus Saccharibacteria bacterium]|nr:exodeoxyribonuclease VII small subunit [Candidatus Saccharibacteria bacterium]